MAARDGHAFIADAVQAGAVAYLTAQPPIEVDATAVRVERHRRGAARARSSRARTRLPDRVIGITGSVGKTTVKDLTAPALATRYSAHANDRSFNNELGVPLTLANAPDDTDVAVVEMGARGRGHIALLCDIARPTIGVVTAVELAHTELFGSLEEVAAAKSELVEALPDSGVAVLNADRPARCGNGITHERSRDHVRDRHTRRRRDCGRGRAGRPVAARVRPAFAVGERGACALPSAACTR